MSNSNMHDQKLFEIPSNFEKNALINKKDYELLYEQSINDPDAFWSEQSKLLDWSKPFTKVKNISFTTDASIKWFEDGELNACYNCIDRHLETRADQTAIIWEGNSPDESLHISYRTLYEEICKFANTLKSMGIKKGDNVVIYMPMIPEAAYSMLACARIGAVHSVVFGGFSPTALQGRINDCDAKLIITADEGRRGNKTVPLKENVDTSLELHGSDIPVLVIKNTSGDITIKSERDIWYHEASKGNDGECPIEIMNAEDPLFILYTSGSTGKPKGILHTTGGYLLYAALTHKYVFDYNEGDIYWCTADVGWITGHSYIIYGPLANAATTLMFEGVPTYPDASRFWQIVDKHKVNIFYTAPTAIRALMSEGNDFVTQTDRSSLRILGTVGEPINKEAWLWYHNIVGESKCPIVDTWWQTETGGHLITPLPGATSLKPGSATLPFFGIKPIILDHDGNEIVGSGEGILCIADSWPGQARSIYGDHKRFIETYFSAYKGYYFTGDGARRDDDGYYWITGRVDDVLNVSGHRLGTAEIENILDTHPKVAEAAVVGYPHDIKGEGIYAYVTLFKSADEDSSLHNELLQQVRTTIGPIASPDFIHITKALPKTRSGKIMRRILRKIAANDYQNLGDTNTLTNPEIVNELIEGRKNTK